MCKASVLLLWPGITPMFLLRPACCQSLWRSGKPLGKTQKLSPDLDLLNAFAQVQFMFSSLETGWHTHLNSARAHLVLLCLDK